VTEAQAPAPTGTCRACAAPLHPGARFCATCGAPVAAPAGDRRVVTVVFAHLVDGASPEEALDPEAVRDRLGGSLRALERVVEAHRGVVDKVVGNELMAIFGAPVAREDDAERAVRATLELQDALARTGSELALRVGVNTGEVLAGPVGPGGDYTVTGDVVNTAHRLLAAARPGEVLVGEPTWLATRGTVEYEARPAFAIRGKRREVRAFAALGALGLPGDRPERVRSAPLVGRAAELERLRAAARLAFEAETSPLLVAVVGEAGLGKTRLLLELQGELWDRLPAGLFLWGRCPSYGASPVWAVAEVIAQAFGMEAGDPHALAREKLAAGLDVALPGAAPVERATVEGHVARLLGLQAVDEAPRRDEPPVPARLAPELLRAAGRVLEGLAESQPTVVVLDDVQWADDLLLDALDRLAAHHQPVPLLVVVVARDVLLDRRPTLGEGWAGGRIELAPLDESQSATVLAHLLGRPRHPSAGVRTSAVAIQAATRSRVVSAAGGNPFFLEELVSYLIEEGALVERDGSWTLVDMAERGLPDSVRAVVTARLDTLPDDERVLLQRASVVGERFSRGLVADLAGLPVAEVDVVIRELLRRGILERTPEPAGDLTFRHVLTRDVIYASVPLAVRASAHVRIAAYLERRYGMDVEGEILNEVAHHYERAVTLRRQLDDHDPLLIDRAWLALVRAARQSARQDALRDADVLFSRARELTGEDGAGEIDAALDHGAVLFGLRRPDDAAATFEAARRAADGVGEVQRAAAATARLAGAHRLLGDHERSQELFDDALARWRAIGDRAGEAETLRLIARGDLHAGRGQRALQALRRSLELVGEGEPSLQQYLGWASFLVGDTETACHDLWEAAIAYAGEGDDAGTAWCLGIFGFALALEGRLAVAAELADNIGRLAVERGDPWGEGMCAVLSGLCASERGDLGGASAAAAAAQARFDALGDRWGVSQVALTHGRVAHDGGDLETARSVLGAGLAAARSVDDAGSAARMLVELAGAEADLGDPEQAERLARRALDVVADGVGDRETEVRAVLVLGRAAQQRQGVEGGRALLEDALERAGGARTTTRRATQAELALVLADVGDLEAAAALVEEADRDHGAPCLRAWIPARRAQAAILAAQGRTDEAAEVLDGALAITPTAAVVPTALLRSDRDALSRGRGA
jgi:class 3 adenylate cyclase/tetratricopeptide (TPR) repeat protein